MQHSGGYVPTARLFSRTLFYYQYIAPMELLASIQYMGIQSKPQVCSIKINNNFIPYPSKSA